MPQKLATGLIGASLVIILLTFQAISQWTVIDTVLSALKNKGPTGAFIAGLLTSPLVPLVLALAAIGFAYEGFRELKNKREEPPGSAKAGETVSKSGNSIATGGSVGPIYFSTVEAPRSTVLAPQPLANEPNLVLVRVLSESLILVGDQWRRGWVESGRPAPRMDAVFAEIKNAKNEFRDVGAALGIKAELTLMRDSITEELADLAWIDHECNTVNFQFAETHFVLLAVKRVSHFAKETHWIIPLNHKGFNDATPGISKIDMSNNWKQEFDIRLRLDLLQIKTGKIVKSFEGQCVWRSGDSGPRITFNRTS